MLVWGLCFFFVWLYFWGIGTYVDDGLADGDDGVDNGHEAGGDGRDDGVEAGCYGAHGCGIVLLLMLLVLMLWIGFIVDRDFGSWR